MDVTSSPRAVAARAAREWMRRHPGQDLDHGWVTAFEAAALRSCGYLPGPGTPIRLTDVEHAVLDGVARGLSDAVEALR